jgi:hypothetical protein
MTQVNKFKDFVDTYSSVPLIAYNDKKLYKVRVIDADPFSDNLHFLDKTATVYVFAKSKTDAQKRVRELSRSEKVKIETGFAREVV